MSDLTDFQEKIFTKLEDDVPAGQVVSYGQLAELVGSSGAQRAVGSAMKKDVAADYPCWRVVGADGAVHEAAIGDRDAVRSRLKEEGVEFVDEYTVDLETCQYREES